MRKNYFKYPVEIVDGIFDDSDVLAKNLGGARVLVVADTNIVQQTEGLGLKIGRYVKEHSIELAGAPVVMGGGEKMKLDELHSVGTVIAAAIAAKLAKEDLILAIGGGSILDVVGYAAAQLRGGIGVVRVPTTPAAMMDAAFAETAAMDASREKDVLVLPAVPRAVIVDTVLANTVLDGVWSAGISEAVRLGLAKDDSLLALIVKLADRFAERDQEALHEIVKAAIDVRRKHGPTDMGLEVAASLEPKSAWKLPHGYAVAIGILADMKAAVAAGKKTEDEFAMILDVLERCGALDGLHHSKHILPPELADF